MEFELVYCVVCDYFDNIWLFELDIVEMFSDEAEAEALADKSVQYNVIALKKRKNNDTNN